MENKLFFVVQAGPVKGRAVGGRQQKNNLFYSYITLLGDNHEFKNSKK